MDADGDEGTGRQAARPMGGTEYMVTLGAGNAYSRSFAPDRTAGNGPRVVFAVQDNSLYMVCDFPVRQRDGRTDYTLYVLSHDAGQDIPANQRMSDSTPRFPVNQVPIQPGPKIRRFVDYTATEGFAGTFRIARIREILFAESTRWQTHDHFESDHVCKVSWRAQNRLYERYVGFVRRHKHRNKAIAAMARELVTFTWEALKDLSCYNAMDPKSKGGGNGQCMRIQKRSHINVRDHRWLPVA